jgi:hypothetical protein
MSEAEDYAWAMKPPSADTKTPEDPQQVYERVKRRLDFLHGEFTSTRFYPGCGFETKFERNKALCSEYSRALSELHYQMHTQGASWAETMSTAVDKYSYFAYYMCTGVDN